MGQYYLVANVDKQEYMKSQGFLKLMEWSYNRNELVLSLAEHMATDWKGDHVYVIGDYAHSEESCQYTDLLRQIEDKIGCYADESIYHHVLAYFKELPVNENAEAYRYIVNHNTHEYIDTEHCPLETWLGSRKENGKWVHTTIAPLSLMLALGNGQGGGDYFAHNKHLVGSWAKDTNKIEITSVKPNKSFKEFRPEFYEKEYVPYEKRDAFENGKLKKNERIR